MEFVRGIGEGAPIWVWPLLGVMLFIGYRSSKARAMPVRVFYFLPLLGVVTLNSVSSLPVPPIAWICFGIGYCFGGVIAFFLQKRWLVKKSGARVSVTGEWFTMTVLMIIFWANFVAGAVQDLSEETYTAPIFVACFALLMGGVSGTFLGRAIRVINYD